MWDKPGISDTHIWNRIPAKWEWSVLKTFFSIMWFLTSGLETTTAPLNPEIVRWVILGESTGQGGEMTLELLLQKYASPKNWSLHPEPSKTAWSQLSYSVASGCLSPMLPTSAARRYPAKWTPQSSSSGSRMLSLSQKSSQWGINCDCHSSFLHSSLVAGSTS